MMSCSSGCLWLPLSLLAIVPWCTAAYFSDVVFCYLSSSNKDFFLSFLGQTVTLAAGTWGTWQTCLPIKRSLARLFSCRARMKLFNHSNASYTSQTTHHYSSRDPGGSTRADNVSSIYRGKAVIEAMLPLFLSVIPFLYYQLQPTGSIALSYANCGITSAFITLTF